MTQHKQKVCILSPPVVAVSGERNWEETERQLLSSAILTLFLVMRNHESDFINIVFLKTVSNIKLCEIAANLFLMLLFIYFLLAFRACVFVHVCVCACACIHQCAP